MLKATHKDGFFFEVLSGPEKSIETSTVQTFHKALLTNSHHTSPSPLR